MLATFAAAQRAKPTPRPPARTAAAPTESPAATESADAAPIPDTASDSLDGGLRSSPLNPAPQEFASNADAGIATPPLDYDRLLADIAALRARVAAVSDSLYRSRVAVIVQTDGDHGKIARLAVSMDDGVVYTAPASFSASDGVVVYDHGVAPGRHAVTVDIERKDDRQELFRTSQRNRFTLDVPRDHRVEVNVKVVDDSTMGKDFPDDKNGQYDLRFRVKVSAKPVGK